MTISRVERERRDRLYESGLRQCTKCAETLPLRSFSKASSGYKGLRSACKSCTYLVDLDWNSRNPEKRTEYARRWREGNPERAREVQARFRASVDQACAIDGCDKRAVNKSEGALCHMHYYRQRVNGDPHTVQPRTGEQNSAWKGDDAGYFTVHRRVRARRGRAATYLCVDCGGQADHWSYDYRCPNERQADQGPYSLDLDRYQSRCFQCHEAFDAEQNRLRRKVVAA